MTTNEQRMEQMRIKLESALRPSHLEILDESHLHRGHSGSQSGKGHFAIIIASVHFTHKTRLMQHRLIYDALADMMETEIHALRISIHPLISS